MAYFAYIVSFVYKFLFSYYAYFSFPNLEKASPTDSSVLIRHFLGVAMHTRVNNGLSYSLPSPRHTCAFLTRNSFNSSPLEKYADQSIHKI